MLDVSIFVTLCPKGRSLSGPYSPCNLKYTPGPFPRFRAYISNFRGFPPSVRSGRTSSVTPGKSFGAEQGFRLRSQTLVRLIYPVTFLCRIRDGAGFTVTNRFTGPPLLSRPGP